MEQSRKIKLKRLFCEWNAHYYNSFLSTERNDGRHPFPYHILVVIELDCSGQIERSDRVISMNNPSPSLADRVYKSILLLLLLLPVALSSLEYCCYYALHEEQ